MKVGLPLAIAFVLGAGAVPGCVCSKSDEQPARPQTMQNPTPVGVQRPMDRAHAPVIRLSPIRALPVVVEAGATADPPH